MCRFEVSRDASTAVDAGDGVNAAAAAAAATAATLIVYFICL